MATQTTTHQDAPSRSADMYAAIDAGVTGSIPSPAVARRHGINRLAKADRLQQHPQHGIDAGVLTVAALFAPAGLGPDLTHAAFALPEAVKAVVAAIAPPAEAAVPPSAAEESYPAPAALLAYAPSDDADGAVKPFEAIMGKQKIGPVVLDAHIDSNHAWLNHAIPAESRSATEVKCLATAIYFEARGESERGQNAVAQVVLNRVKNPAYPGTICGVVYQNKNKRNRCQFSFACDGIKDRVNDKESWLQSMSLARRVLNDDHTLFMAEVGAATHYHAVYVRPRWARSMKKMQKIGRHVFYKTYGGGWS